MKTPSYATNLCSKNVQKLNFLYDTSPPFGAKEHFFHFLHGYVIPALHWCHEVQCRHVSFEDCGPLMNPKLAEACQLASLDCSPLMHVATQEQDSSTQCIIPRWDVQLIRFDGANQTPSEISMFRSKTAYILQFMLDRAQEVCKKQGTLEQWQQIDILVLRRSPDHPYYAPGGKVKFPKYGRGRRALLNTLDIANHLAKSGYSVKEVDMGKLPLWEQIIAFHNASSVIGARGAEFAHLFWMRPGATAVMFATPTAKENNASRSLSEIFNLRFISPKVESNFFSVEPEEIRAYLP
ncbi:glycosyltransferase 61 family protein [Desulfovibrio inopinatus]|uniref:glycosyltransferase 61 family protein n=1 Tax=Desulfovibrio inopinatus TaxID=102109 RepID=UPI00047FA89C|nr:glycosyltransferase family 61 protein [Desulfovibrio inopinatus]